MSFSCSALNLASTSPSWPTTPTSPLLLRVCAARPGEVLVTGELDLSGRDQFMLVATAGRYPEMVIDLAGCTFMDCTGYDCLVAARQAIEGQGRSLTITGQTGQPARLWKLIGDLERPPVTPA